MNAHNEFKRPFDQGLNARFVLAAAQRRFAALVDVLVARWLERCAANAEAAQWWFKADRNPVPELEAGASLVSSPRWNECP